MPKKSNSLLNTEEEYFPPTEPTHYYKKNVRPKVVFDEELIMYYPENRNGRVIFLCLCGNIGNLRVPPFIESPMCKRCKTNGVKKIVKTEESRLKDKQLAFFDAYLKDLFLESNLDTTKVLRYATDYHELMTYKCVCNERITKTVEAFIKGHKLCKDCRPKLISKKPHARALTYEKAIEFLEEHNYTMLTSKEDYKNASSSINVKDPTGKLRKTTLKKLKFQLK